MSERKFHINIVQLFDNQAVSMSYHAHSYHKKNSTAQYGTIDNIVNDSTR